jgi:hypothetical protein
MAEKAADKQEKAEAGPIVVERQKTEKKERRNRLKDVQESESNILKAVSRVSGALDTGVNAYIDARDKSVEKKGDEAFADILPNLAKGMQAAIEAIAPLPTDLVNAFYPTRARDLVGDGVRTVGSVLNLSSDSDDDDDK